MNIFDIVKVGGSVATTNRWGERLEFEVTPEIHKALYVWAGLATLSSVATGFEDELQEAQLDVLDALDDASSGEFKRLFGEGDAMDSIDVMLERTFFEGYDETVHACGYGDLSEPSFLKARCE